MGILEQYFGLAGKTVLRAPISGLITACNVEKGERAVPGIQSNPVATLMTIADMSVIEAEKTRRAAAVASRTGLFDVPEIIGGRPEEGRIVFERIGGVVPLWTWLVGRRHADQNPCGVPRLRSFLFSFSGGLSIVVRRPYMTLEKSRVRAKDF